MQNTIQASLLRLEREGPNEPEAFLDEYISICDKWTQLPEWESMSASILRWTGLDEQLSDQLLARLDGAVLNYADDQQLTRTEARRDKANSVESKISAANARPVRNNSDFEESGVRKELEANAWLLRPYDIVRDLGKDAVHSAAFLTGLRDIALHFRHTEQNQTPHWVLVVSLLNKCARKRQEAAESASHKTAQRHPRDICKVKDALVRRGFADYSLTNIANSQDQKPRIGPHVEMIPLTEPSIGDEAGSMVDIGHVKALTKAHERSAAQLRPKMQVNRRKEHNPDNHDNSFRLQSLKRRKRDGGPSLDENGIWDCNPASGASAAGATGRHSDASPFHKNTDQLHSPPFHGLANPDQTLKKRASTMSSDPNSQTMVSRDLNHAIQSLAPREWVSATAIEEILEILNPDPLKYFIVNAVSVTTEEPLRGSVSLRSLTTHSHIIIPAKCGPSHWTVAIADITTREVSIYDSFQQELYRRSVWRPISVFLKHLELRNKRVKEAGNGDWKRVKLQYGPKQRNGFDCGIYCITGVLHWWSDTWPAEIVAPAWRQAFMSLMINRRTNEVVDRSTNTLSAYQWWRDEADTCPRTRKSTKAGPQPSLLETYGVAEEERAAHERYAAQTAEECEIITAMFKQLFNSRVKGGNLVKQSAEENFHNLSEDVQLELPDHPIAAWQRLAPLQEYDIVKAVRESVNRMEDLTQQYRQLAIDWQTGPPISG